ncbi:MAG: RimK family alpha-L-glutamate ligase [Candidatus Undinarchaeales archaeon]|jgi:[lysine-biosynthesis-protein LysW]--L-2-aminoadipate ligase|nr:RimK family alpha-L-glutamate ligase [Candidatus Undinarchaeales archaeon]MDP7493860.1 RimK family alpha-L-glutamate ligase [Candidatus Undinarchaeales archaeon]
MSLNIGLFTRKLTWENQKVLVALIKKGCDVLTISPEEIRFEISDGIKARLEDYDLTHLSGVYNRLDVTPDLGMPYHAFQAIKYIDKAGVPIVNSPASIARAHNKFNTFAALMDGGIRLPRTILAQDVVQAESILNRSDLPLVIKPVFGSWGRDAFLVNDLEEGHYILENLSERGWFHESGILIQRYIDNPGRDIRALVVEDRVVAAMYRYAPRGEWRTNISLGGRGEPCKITPEIEELAVRSLELLGGEIMGVDLMESKEGLFVLEVNGSADFRGLTRATGVDVKEIIADYLIKTFKR